MASTQSPGAALLHKHDGELIALLTPMGMLAIASVVLRFVARFKTKAGFSGDDVCCVMAFAFWAAYWGLNFSVLQTGIYGVPILSLPPLMIVDFLRGAYIGTLLTIICVTFAKVSILWLYWRLFATRKFRLLVWIVGAYSVAWGVAALFACIFRCSPIKGAWQVYQPHTCTDFLLFFQVSEPLNMLSELLIVLIPINVVRGLKLPLRRKLQLYFIFGLGSFVTLISIIRLAETGTSILKLTTTNSARWLFIQVTLAVVVISLPTYGPLVGSLEVGGKNFKKWYSSLVSRKSRSSKSSQTGSSGSESKITVHHEYSLEHRPHTADESDAKGAKVFAMYYPPGVANEHNMV